MPGLKESQFLELALWGADAALLERRGGMFSFTILPIRLIHSQVLDLVSSELSARPPAFYMPEMAKQIELRSFDDLSALADADWVIEAVVEELSIKRELLARVEAGFRACPYQ